MPLTHAAQRKAHASMEDMGNKPSPPPGYPNKINKRKKSCCGLAANRKGEKGFIEGCLAALCCCCLCEACF